MKLVKTNENINRSFNSEGGSEDRVESANYAIVDAEDNQVGNATILAHGRAEVRVNEIYGFSSIEEGEAKVKELFGISCND